MSITNKMLNKIDSDIAHLKQGLDSIHSSSGPVVWRYVETAHNKLGERIGEQFLLADEVEWPADAGYQNRWIGKRQMVGCYD